MWLHSSPAWIEPGAHLLPPAVRGVPPRTFPAGGMDDAVAKGWYDPNRVYVFWTEVEPANHLDRFAFTRRDYFMYEVVPEDIGEDHDPLAAGKGWASCAKATVLSCVHTAEQIQAVDV